MNAQAKWRELEPGAAPLGARRDLGPNVTGLDRWLSIGGGAALVALALGKRGPSSLLLGVIGAAFVGRGLGGHDPIKRSVQPAAAEREIADERGWKTASVTGSAVTIGKPRAELYAFWREFPNLAKVMDNIESITKTDDKRSHWVVKAPGGRTVEWDAIVTEDEPDRRISWASAEGASVQNAGTVEFRDAPAGRGTEIHALIAFEPPHGMAGRAVAALFLKDPSIQMREDLKRLKMLMETGEVATSKAPDASPRG